MNLIEINGHSFPTDLAIEKDDQSKGLMFYEDEHPVMSFVYLKPKTNKFWMKNTYVPLDIVFCSKSKIQYICEGVPESLDEVGPDFPTDLVVELPKGTCSKFDFKVGDDVNLVCDSVGRMSILRAIKNQD